MNIATEILVEAKRILEEDVDWCQAALFLTGNGTITHACTVGAMTMAAGNLGYGESEYFKAENRVREVLFEQGDIGIVSFNDAKSTTKEDVFLVLKRAIESE